MSERDERVKRMTAIVREVRETLFALGRAEVAQATMGRRGPVGTDAGLVEAEGIDAAAARLDELVHAYVTDLVTAALAARLAPPPPAPTPELVTQARQKAVAQAAAVGQKLRLFLRPEDAEQHKGTIVPYGRFYAVVRGRAVAEVERVTARVEVFVESEDGWGTWYPVLVSG